MRGSLFVFRIMQICIGKCSTDAGVGAMSNKSERGLEMDLLEVGLKKRNGEIEKSWNELAKGTRFRDGEAFRVWVARQANKKQHDGKASQPKTEEDFEIISGKDPKTHKDTIKIHEDGSQSSIRLLEMTLEESQDTESILKKHGYNVDVWKVFDSESSIWGVYSKQDGIQTLYSSRVRVRPREDEFTLEMVSESIKELMADFKPPIHKPTRYESNGKLLEINITDFHLDKLGFMDGVYDPDMAEKAFFHVLNDVLTRTGSMKFEKILFIWSHDFFNIDNLSKTTTAGTPQDSVMRYSDMYKKGKAMLIKGIDLLSQVSEVETVQVGANHDRLTSYTMSEVLDAWFKDYENVTIDTDPLSRKYRKFGKCLIGFSHGNKERSRLGKIMPSEARKAWGETLYAEIHAAHIHTEKAVEEDNGVIVRYLSTTSGTDNWHFESGYVGAVPKAQSFIWDKELGLTDIIHTPLVPNYPDLVKIIS